MRSSLTWLTLIWLSDMHFLPFFEGIGGIDDDLIADLDPAKNLQRGPEVTPNSDGAQMHLPVLVNDRDLGSLGTEQHGVYRDRNPWNRSPRRKMHLAKRPWQQLAVFIGDIHLGVQGSCRRIDGLGGADNRSQELLAGEFLQGY